ncbi:hypothetical protein BHM03_00014017 [Ensete ventricosum]|nr:hypothetical protein BHM03_00014017 [Ensete ventricosum]
MVALVSRRGRTMQRYNSGCRLVAGCVSLIIFFCSLFLKTDKPSLGDIDQAIEVMVVSSQKGRELMFPKVHIPTKPVDMCTICIENCNVLTQKCVVFLDREVGSSTKACKQQPPERHLRRPACEEGLRSARNSILYSLSIHPAEENT